MLVKLNCTAYDIGVGLKMAMPIGVAEHDIRGAVRPMLIGSMEKPAKIRTNAQLIEIVSGPFCYPHATGVATCVQPGRSDGETGETVEAAIAVAQVRDSRDRIVRDR